VDPTLILSSGFTSQLIEWKEGFCGEWKERFCGLFAGRNPTDSQAPGVMSYRYRRKEVVQLNGEISGTSEVAGH